MTKLYNPLSTLFERTTYNLLIAKVVEEFSLIQIGDCLADNILSNTSMCDYKVIFRRFC